MPKTVKYDLDTINVLLQKYQNLPFKERFNLIGKMYGVKGTSVHRWYYRHQNDNSNATQNQDSLTVTIPKIQALEKNSEYWRFLYALVAGENGKQKFKKGKIAAIKKELVRLIRNSS